MNRTELEKLLPEGTTIFGVEEDAKLVIRMGRKHLHRAESLAESFRRFDVKALVIVMDADEIDIYKINKKLLEKTP